MAALIAPNPDFATDVARLILDMPGALYGFHFTALTPGYAELVQPYRKELSCRDGVFLGAVIGALADFAGGSAAFTLLPAGGASMTIDYTLKIVAPGAGEALVARGRVIRPGASVTVSGADVYAVRNQRETLCATALVTMRHFKVAESESRQEEPFP